MTGFANLATRRRRRQCQRFALVAFVCIVLYIITFQASPWAYLFGCGCQSDELVRMLQNADSIHTISGLWLEARTEQEAKLQRQSQSLEQARKEYSRWYAGIQPPPGFDKWYYYAKAQNSAIIDDYDGIMKDLKPWRSYFDASCDQSRPKSIEADILSVCFKDGKPTYPHEPNAFVRSEYIEQLEELVKPFQKEIPDLCFDWNLLDEPRSLLSPDGREGIWIREDSQSCDARGRSWIVHEDDKAWGAVTATCDAASAARLGHTRSSDTAALIKSWNTSTDLCTYTSAPPIGMLQSPSQVISKILGPSLMETTASNIPILSSGTLSTFADIRIPSAYRLKFSFTSSHDAWPCWRKRAAVGWRGSSTGGLATDKEIWHKFLRHRAVLLASGFNLGTSGDDNEVVVSTPRLERRLDVRFSKIVGCNAETCDDMANTLPPSGWTSLRSTLRNEVLLDMDGNGLSGRLYHLLSSNSAVLKQGLFREWHDDRLIPWLHYIPLSVSMMELDGLLEFLFEDEVGVEIRRAIAVEGKKWVRKALSREAQGVYVYRLFLEMGRRRERNGV